MADDDNDAKPSRDARIDMAIPESFHRVKRTLIVLCSILILLAVSKPKTPGDAEINMQLLSLHVPIIWARTLLWLSALYYAFGLWLEMDTARRVNTSLFDGGDIQSFKEALQSITRRVVRETDTVHHSWSLGNDATNSLEHIRKLEPRHDYQLARQLLEDHFVGIARRGDLHQKPMETMRDALDKVFSRLTSSGERPAVQLKDELARIEARLEREAEMLTRLEDSVEKAVASLEKLSKKITRSRHFSFWFWEVGASYSLFIVATAATVYAHFRAF